MNSIEGRYEELFLCGYRTARTVLFDRDEAADVASEAVARAFARWNRIEAYAPAWVTRVSVNLALGHLRRRRRRPCADRLVDGEPSLDRVALAVELARLPRRQREVLVLRFLVDLDEERTAKVLGVSIGTVHTHASRGLARLRQIMPPEGLLGGELL
jgi:RNA polymerase sigma factor (sigma-70 family)